MFGTLKPHTCRLGCDRLRTYESFYCGLCKSLGDHFGQATRALLNYDAVFLALVAEGLMDEPAAPDRCRCPLMPITFRPTLRPDSASLRYAAAMQLLLADQWLADRAEDGRRVARAARPLLSGKVDVARAILSDLGVSLDDLTGFERVQAAREIVGVTGPREAAEPTAAALARVFSRMVELPGMSVEARSAEARAALEAFGRHLGSAIYLIDALDDLSRDHRDGAFNPCVVRARHGGALRVSWPRVEVTWSLLREDLTALDELALTLPLRRHRDLVASVVAVELRRLAQEAAARAHAYARAEDARERAGRLGRPWAVRAAAAIAAGFVFAWMWLLSFPSIARGGPPPRRTPDAGARDAGAKGGVPPIWEPRLPPTSAPRPTTTPAAPTTQPAPSKPGPAGTASPGGTGRPGAGASTEPSKPGPPETPGKPGGVSPCKNPCDEICGGCLKSITSSCDGCCKSCNVCDSCCKDFKGCGGCCKTCDSCNGCCNSCNGGCGGCCK